ncbi:MAG: GNAT family N-acetyltransferase [Candidatus Micrarchaeota archaeon]
MKIRLVEGSDLKRVAKLDSEVFPQTDFAQGLKVFRKAFKNRIAGASFVAEEGKELVGAIIIEKKLSFTVSNTSFITSFFVKKNWRKKGVGRSLLNKCLSALRRRGISSVSLTVHPRNKLAIRLYKKWGFKLYRLAYLKEL